MHKIRSYDRRYYAQKISSIAQELGDLRRCNKHLFFWTIERLHRFGCEKNAALDENFVKRKWGTLSRMVTSEVPAGNQSGNSG